MTRRHDWYVFCDICGKRCFASETTKLSNETGRGGLIVCQADVDNVDYGLIPYNVQVEKRVSFARAGFTDTSNDYPVFDLETNNVGDLSDYLLLAESQDGDVLELSQDIGILISLYKTDRDSTVEQLSSYIYLSTSQGFNEIIVISQADDEDILIALSQEK